MNTSQLRQLAGDYSQLMGVSFRDMKGDRRKVPRTSSSKAYLHNSQQVSRLLRSYLVDLIGMEVHTP